MLAWQESSGRKETTMPLINVKVIENVFSSEQKHQTGTKPARAGRQHNGAGASAAWSADLNRLHRRRG
jgi:hypothetical protein